MDTRRARAAIALVLVVLALGAAGAALDDGAGGGGEVGVGDGEGAGVGEGEDGFELFPESQPPEITGDGDWLSYLLTATFVGAVVWLVVAIALAVLRRDLSALFEALKRVAIVTGIALLAMAGLILLVTLLEVLFGSGGGSPGLAGSGEDVGIGDGPADGGVQLPMGPVVFVLVLLVLTGAVLLRSRTGGGSEPDRPREPDADGREQPATAGRSADWVRRPASDDVPADNEVYRAWLALADEAGADPARDSPDEVARQAVDRGLDGEAVRELTALFEAVRYGDAAATAEREERAAEARAALASDSGSAGGAGPPRNAGAGGSA